MDTEALRVRFNGDQQRQNLRNSRKIRSKNYFYDGTLLGARAEGIKSSKGEFILLMDSDQILNKGTIEGCLKK
jgi:hypothetical protein